MMVGAWKENFAPKNGKGVPLKNKDDIAYLSTDAVLLLLRSSRAGLTSKEAYDRLKIYGANELSKRQKRGAVIQFLTRFKSPLVIILMIAGLISGLTRQAINAAIILSIILVSVVLDFYQESKAEKASDMLKEKVATTATVLRDGRKQEIKLSQVVPGDILYLSAGDIAPADARVIESKDLFMNQSALTGESFPVEKASSIHSSRDASLIEWKDYLFMGTSVVSGSATAVAVKTGSSTEYGKIAKKLAGRQPETEFERGIRKFGYLIMQVTVFLVIFVFLVNSLYMRDVLQSLLFAVALAVGITPELLPMIITVNLSRGAMAMAKKGVIVKRLSSIQDFGSMDVLCTDKTGTLTENKITLVKHIDIEGNDDEKVLLFSFLNSLYETGLKSPIDDAILRHKEVDTRGYEKIDEIPFDFIRKRVSIVAEIEGQRFLISKGAPEEISEVCSSVELRNQIGTITGDLRKEIEQRFSELSSDGFRVLAISYKRVEVSKQVFSVDDENEMSFLGFVAFIDPPKETARESLQLLRKAGVEVKILTGDNEKVTSKICEQLGFEVKDIVLGKEIAEMHDDALIRVVERANVFARVTPAQKDRILHALKNNQHVLGFLGDGINDAPSLKTADVGISVDNAVDVAKETADIILLEKKLRVLNDGVLEGRKTFGNTMKYIMMGTSSNFGNMFSVAGGSLFLPFLPMLPVQILLNNLLYDLSGLSIPTDNVDFEYVSKPKKLDISLIRRFMIFLGPISSVFDFLTFFLLLFLLNSTAPLFQTAWFIESLCTQVLVVFVIRTRRWPFYKSRPSVFLLLSCLGIVAIALVLPLTPVGVLFQFTEPPWVFFVFLAGLTVAYLLIVDFLKAWFYRRYLQFE
jgi:Mg2+-importing ATPase